MATEGTEPVDSDDPGAELCRKMANYQVNFIRREGPDHSFACEDHLAHVLLPIIKTSFNGAARVSKVPLSSDEPCEFGVQ